MLVRDRADAGRQLADRLRGLRLVDPVVLGLPRGGVPVGYEIAAALDAPLDVIVVRKLGVPHYEELAMGAVGEHGARVLDDQVLADVSVSDAEMAAVIERERARVEEQAARFRSGRPAVALAGRTLVVVDDGIATGSSMRAACQVARASVPERIVVAVPVAPAAVLPAMRKVADDVVCLHTPHPFMAVGLWYHDFSQVSDDDVVDLLNRAVPH